MSKKIERIDSLDYLRGIMALSVMIYHYTSWSISPNELGSENLLGKLGIYAVSVFYILSGLSLSMVYNNRIHSKNDVASFFIKRLFRLFPLFWLSIFLVFSYKCLVSLHTGSELGISLYDLFLNLTLLFGFINPSAYLSVGAWSIGNEVVFYSIIPVLFYFSGRYKAIIPLCFLLSMILAVYFSFQILSDSLPLSEQWHYYINPFNQLFLFLSGVILFYIAPYSKIISKKLWSGLLIVLLLSFYLLPVNGDLINLVTNWNRLLFSALCILTVLAIYIINPKFHTKIAGVFSFMGQGCYSIYLLHPIVSIPVVMLMNKMGLANSLAYIFSAILTLIVSALTYKYIEKPMMDLGKKLSKRLSRK